MAQDLVQKRRNLASNAVVHATRLADAIYALRQLKDEFAHVGSYAQSDFDGTDLAHLTPGLMNAVFGGGGVVDDFAANFDEAANKQNLLQLRR
jgi:hypothetical protein